MCVTFGNIMSFILVLVLRPIHTRDVITTVVIVLVLALSLIPTIVFYLVGMMYQSTALCILPLSIIILLMLLGMLKCIDATPTCICLLCCIIPFTILMMWLLCIELNKYKK